VVARVQPGQSPSEAALAVFFAAFYAALWASDGSVDAVCAAAFIAREPACASLRVHVLREGTLLALTPALRAPFAAERLAHPGTCSAGGAAGTPQSKERARAESPAPGGRVPQMLVVPATPPPAAEGSWWSASPRGLGFLG